MKIAQIENLYIRIEIGKRNWKLGEKWKLEKDWKLEKLKNLTNWKLHQIKKFYKRIEIGKNGRLDQIENNFKIFLK